MVSFGKITTLYQGMRSLISDTVYSHFVVFSELMDDISLFITSVLGESDNCSTVVEHLQRLGADTLDDLQYLDAEAELSDVLPLLKRRRLNASIKERFAKKGKCSIFHCLFAVMLVTQLSAL